MPAAPVSPQYDGQISQHLRAVLKSTHRTALVVFTGDRQFDDPQRSAPGDTKDFDVEHEPVHPLTLEQRARRGALECLEAALRVADAWYGDSAHNPVEDSAERLSERL